MNMTKTYIDENQHWAIFGCGYVGTALAEELLKRGHRVSALTRNPDKAVVLRRLGVHKVVCARLDSDEWHEMTLEPVDIWVNCVSSAGNGLEGYQQSYIDGMRSILQWSDRYQPGIKRALYTSSTSVYPQNNGEWVDETADCSAAPATGKILLEAEDCLLQHRAAYPRFVLRLAGIYGPGRSYLIRQLTEGDGVIPGSGDYTMNCIHRHDCVSAILALLHFADASAAGIYNAADDQPMHKAEVMGALAELMSLPTPRFEPALQSERLRRRGGRMPDRRISNRKLKQTTGWLPRYPSCLSGYSGLLNTL